MIKVLYLLQENQISQKKPQCWQKNIFDVSYGFLVPFSEEPCSKQFKFSEHQSHQSSSLISYPSHRTTIKWKKEI